MVWAYEAKVDCLRFLRRRLRVRWRCCRRLLELLCLCGFFLGVGGLYRALPIARPPSAQHFGAPKVVVIYSAFSEAEVGLLGDSVRGLHAELGDLDVVVLAESQRVLDDPRLRFPAHDPIRLLRVTPNGTADFNPNLLQSADYFVFPPPNLPLTRKLLGVILDKFWQPSCWSITSTGFEADEELRIRNSLGVGAPRMVRSQPKPRTAHFQEASSCADFLLVGGCCWCPGVWSPSGAWVGVAAAGRVLELPRPWLGPPELGLSTQLFLLARRPSVLCSEEPLRPQPPIQALNRPMNQNKRTKDLHRILAYFDTKLIFN